MDENTKKNEPQDSNVENPNVAETDNLSTEESSADVTPETETETETDKEEGTSTAEGQEKDPETKKEEKRGLFGKRNKKEEELKKRIAELEEQKKELTDKYLHLYSEFDNYKKRTNREKLELIETASEKVILNLLPVIDDFERAIKANEKLEDTAVLKEGFNLIYNKLIQLLKRFDVTEIEAKGEAFDTDLHEAVTHFPAPTEEEKGKVIDVTEKGYKIKGKVIRYAKVVVGQ